MTPTVAPVLYLPNVSIVKIVRLMLVVCPMVLVVTVSVSANIISFVTTVCVTVNR